jgi:uncharacterized SAM-binding protein YcdF (DUF218 family)
MTYTENDILLHVGPRALEAGRVYQRQRRVTSFENHGDGAMTATVQGNERRPYRQDISVTRRATGQIVIESDCSCPIGQNCKHVAAALLEGMARASAPFARAALSERSRRRLCVILTDVVTRAFLAGALISTALGYAVFDSFDTPSETEVRGASAAVVFTGQFARVDAGLQLVYTGAVPRLYVSGVNARAGILPAHFVSQFSARNQNIADLRPLVECCVEWGERADNTFQNARDTKCWVNRRGSTGPLLLITSRRHMARALAALSGTLSDRVIVPYPVDDASPSVYPMRMRTFDYVKYLSTIVAVRLPWIVGAQRLYGPFAEACPTGEREGLK